MRSLLRAEIRIQGWPQGWGHSSARKWPLFRYRGWEHWWGRRSCARKSTSEAGSNDEVALAHGNCLFSATEAGRSDEVALARGNGLFSATEAGRNDEVALARGNGLFSASEAGSNDDVTLARENPRPRPAASCYGEVDFQEVSKFFYSIPSSCWFVLLVFGLVAAACSLLLARIALEERANLRCLPNWLLFFLPPFSQKTTQNHLLHHKTVMQ